jgi:hypothetical protein
MWLSIQPSLQAKAGEPTPLALPTTLQALEHFVGLELMALAETAPQLLGGQFPICSNAK